MAPVVERVNRLEVWRERLDDQQPRGLPGRIDDLEDVIAEFRGLTKTLKAFAALVSTAVGLLTFVLLIRGML